jgi:Leucine-rich repeat (LRR) protein
MILQASNCDNLAEVQGLVLREKEIGYFGSSPNCQVDELIFIEFMNLSHNYLTDVAGMCKLTSLVELNLNFNKLTNLVGIEELVNLEKLWVA